MKKSSFAVLLLLVAPCQALAQPSERAFLPFVFAAPGSISGGTTTLHFGGGFETIFLKGIGAGAELGYLGPLSALDYGIGVLSLNGIYEPLKRGRRVTPFVTGGYSLAFREGTGNALNFGGGFNYWMRDGMALRVEFRDHLPMYAGSIENYHLWGLRIGITWKR